MKKNPSNVTTSTSTATSQALQPSHEEIAQRAYELWLQDGCPTGRAVYHWHEAERQLLKAKQNLQHAPNPNDRSLASLSDDSSPYNALEKEAPLSAKVERNLAKTNIKSVPSSGGSVNLD